MNLTESPSLTVAVPTCNGSRHIREALASLRDQGDVAFDLLVSDDRSDDDTPAIVLEACGDRARISVNPERLGLAGNWNRCVDLTRTEWVAIFHQDDVMRPGHIASHLRAIIAHPAGRVGLVAGPVAMIDAAGRPIPPSVVEPGNLTHPRLTPGRSEAVAFAHGEWLQTLMIGNPLRCPGVTTRKAAHRAVGGFDPSYRYAVDWDFWVRVARGWGLIWLPGPPTVAMRWHPDSETHRFRSSTTDLDEQKRLLDDLYRRDGPQLPDARARRRLADRRLARAFLNRAHVALKAGDPSLARRSLARSIRISPAILGTIALDPRLAAQMTALVVAPEQAGRWWNRRLGDSGE